MPPSVEMMSFEAFWWWALIDEYEVEIELVGDAVYEV